MFLLQNFVKEASYSLAKVKTKVRQSKTNRKGLIPNFHQEDDIFLFDGLHYFVGLNYKNFNVHCNKGPVEKMKFTWIFAQSEGEVCPIRGLIIDWTKDLTEDGERGDDSFRVRCWYSSSAITSPMRSSSIDCLRSCLVNSFGARLSASLRMTSASVVYLKISEGDRKAKHTGRR